MKNLIPLFTFILCTFSGLLMGQQDQMPERTSQDVEPNVVTIPSPRDQAVTAESAKADYRMKKTDQAPLFPGCEEMSDYQKRKICAQQDMLKFIYSNLKYPPIARENKVEGTIVVRFTVMEDGSLANAEVVRDVGAGCGAEGVRVVKLMPKWHPGKREGTIMPMEFNLPIKFRLE